MVQSLAQADLFKSGSSRGVGGRSLYSGNPLGHGGILECAELGQKVVELENKPDLPIPAVRGFPFIGCQNRFARQHHLTFVGSVQPTEKMKKRALSRSRCPQNGKEFGSRDMEVQTTEDLDAGISH
jgi:hypothetical protein